MSEWILKATPDSLPANAFSLGAIRKFENKSYPIRDKAIFGRDESCCDYTLPWKHVSRQHTEITVVADALEVRDLASANGTFINGKKISVATAKPGDIIGFDKITLVVQGPNQQPDSSPPSPLQEDFGNATVVRPLSSVVKRQPPETNHDTPQEKPKKNSFSFTIQLKGKAFYLVKGMLYGLIVAGVVIAILNYIRG